MVVVGRGQEVEGADPPVQLGVPLQAAVGRPGNANRFPIKN